MNLFIAHSPQQQEEIRVKQEPEEPRIKEEPEDDCGGKGMRDEIVSQKDSSEPDFMVKQEIKQEIKQEAKQEVKQETKLEVKAEIKEEPTESTTDLNNADRGTRKIFVFKPEDLRQALMPTLEQMFRQDPESLPFRQPVDAQALCIPDYFDIVSKPIDLSTIKSKLDRGVYKDPWEYVDDVWLMFENAWLYNRKNSRVYRYCTKVRYLNT